MFITLISTLFGAGIAGLFAFVLLLINEYFFNSGTGVPNGFDYLIVFGLIVLPIAGAILGALLGHKLHSEGKTASVFFTSAYISIPLALLILVGVAFMLTTVIAKRASIPPAQNTVLVSQLHNTSWSRKAQNSELEVLAKAQPYQIGEISFKGDDTACVEGRSYVLTYTSGKSAEGCWNIAANANILTLSAKGSSTGFYQNIDVAANTLSFESAGQVWTFVKAESR